MRILSVLLCLSVFGFSASGCREKNTDAPASTASAKGAPPKGDNSTVPDPTTPTAQSLSAVWANDGGDKITRDERRASLGGSSSVLNRIWDGNKVQLFGARNEVVSFNLVLENGTQAVSGMSVSFNELTGPGGFKITSTPTTGNGVFNWTNRNIELFLVRYLQIKGLSRLSYEVYDERHIPARFRRPYDSAGVGSGTWEDRPDHDKFYPEIAVPMEIAGNSFSIAANENQSVWVDIYIPKTAPAGAYSGTVAVSRSGSAVESIPVTLEVKSFTLPDEPTAKTMVFLGYTDVANRYTGEKYPAQGTANDQVLKRVRDRHFLVAHRHKISLIDANQGSSPSPGDRPRDEWLPRLDGSLFTAANGYAGPGVGTGNGVFSIGTYGGWGWKAEGESGMRLHTDAWEQWFVDNSPTTERFLYLIDESSDYAQIEQWAQWIANNPGVGRNLKSMATLRLTSAIANTPTLSVSASWFSVGDTTQWTNAYAQARAATPPKRIFMYNGKRPSNGSFAIEDDGVALRELAWAQYKKGIDRWYFWESTYYNNYQGGRGETNVFQNAATFGGLGTRSASLGETGWNYSNGDGVLFYPGIDKVFPSESYGLEGPIASLRLKHWRRGIQDVDYIKLAAAVNPTLTQQVVERMVPKALWDYGVGSASDPTWVRADISWSIDPDDWEKARQDLANIIEGKPITAANSSKSSRKPARGRVVAEMSTIKGSLHKVINLLSAIKSRFVE